MSTKICEINIFIKRFFKEFEEEKEELGKSMKKTREGNERKAVLGIKGFKNYNIIK